MATKGTQGEADAGQTDRPPLAVDVRAPLEALLKALSQLIQHVKETAFELVPGAPLVPPVPGFQQAAQLVSDYCTKLAVLFSSPSPSPSPADCAALCGRLGQTASHLVATYHHISPSYGVVLHQDVKRCALAILRGVESLVNSIITTGSSTAQHGLKVTGSVWEYCDRAAKISRDDKMAAVRELLSQLQLIRDGCREVQEVVAESGKWGGGGGDLGEICEGVRSVQLEGESGGPREWTEREKQLAEPCVHLVKLCSEITTELCRVVVTNGEWNVKEGKVAELDTTVAVVLELSPLVDELAGELPAPLLWHDCREAGERLAAAVTQILHTVSPFHFCRTAGDKWMELHKKYLTSVTALTQQMMATAPET